MIYVSPTEPKAVLQGLGDLARVSPASEKFGVDMLWVNRGVKCGVQRKTVQDFVASLEDGRLWQQLSQMRQLDHRWVVIEEGTRIQWTQEGMMMLGSWGKTFRKSAWWSAIATVSQTAGVLYTSNVHETCECIKTLETWSRKPAHGVPVRVGPVSVWGVANDRDYGIHLLSGLPGVGRELAARIFDEYGVPWKWRVTQAEMLKLKGVGQKMVDRMWKAIPDG